MKILWFTGRKFDNFVLQLNLRAMGLINRGHTIHFLNPDESNMKIIHGSILAFQLVRLQVYRV